MADLHLYGISNCDTVKKARKWLQEHALEHHFHDFKKEAPTREQLQRWCEHVGWEVLLNRRGTTWRKLPESDREGLDQAKAIALMQAQPSMIKRPVMELGQSVHVGFDTDTYSSLLL